MMGCTTAPGEKTLAPARALHKDHTYELVSKVAYLIGVPLRIFENEHEPPKLELYDQLERDKNARIIRNLCIIRTAIERNYKRINDAMRMECRGLLSMPELIPSASLQQLSDDGVNFITKFSTKLCHHVIEVNRLISDRINNCKSLFPVWINWAYLKELFLMPDGLTESGTKAAAGLYYANLSYYPYQMYINWAPADEGNILYSDRKFADLLYQWHCDAFTEYSKVSDAGAFVKNNIGNVKKCAVGKHPKSEKHGNTAQFSEVERSGTQENCGGIGSGRRLRLRPLPVLHRRQPKRVARIDPNAVVVDKNIAENDRFDLFSR